AGQRSEPFEPPVFPACRWQQQYFARGAAHRSTVSGYPILKSVGLKFFRRQIAICGPVNHAPDGVITRAVTGTVPGFLGCVPRDHAPEMNADGGHGVNWAVLMAV